MAFLDGDTKPVVDRLEAEMRQASDELEFERAARLRDRLATVRLAIERQQMVTDTPENLDAIAIAEDELEAAVQVLHVRRGRVVGRHGFIVEKVEPLTTPQLSGGCSSSTTPRRRSGSPASCSSPSCRRTWPRTRPGSPGSASGKVTGERAAAGPQAGAPRHGAARTPPTSSFVTACGGRATSRAVPSRSRSCRPRSG